MTRGFTVALSGRCHVHIDCNVRDSPCARRKPSTVSSIVVGGLLLPCFNISAPGAVPGPTPNRRSA